MEIIYRDGSSELIHGQCSIIDNKLRAADGSIVAYYRDDERAWRRDVTSDVRQVRLILVIRFG